MRAFGAAGGLEGLGERLGLVLVERLERIDHHLVRAVLTRHSGFLLAGDSGDNFRAVSLAQLHRRQPHAACCTQHQQGVASLQVPAIEQPVHIGAIGHQQRCPGFKAHAIGQREQLVGRCEHFFSQSAVAHHRNHAVTHVPLRHAFTHRSNHPRQLAARRERALRFELVHVLDDQHVGKVDRTGLDRDPDLAGAGLRGLNLVKGQALGSAGGVAA